ncbi:Ada metal-binding domain-containing protein [Larkinella ripae]
MIWHRHFSQDDSGKLELRRLIKTGEIRLGGNAVLKIYGTLRCRSGQRMRPKNRVFFASEDEAIRCGFRPCGHCLPEKYRQWKNRVSH